jgi:DNA replication protein DnaC
MEQPTQSEQPSNECPVCKGSGWKMIALPGRAEGAVRCECFILRRADRLFKMAGIPPRYQSCTLDNFQAAHNSLARARMAALHFVENYPNEKEGLLFAGETGRGKTHLAVAIIHELTLKKGIRCLFCEYRDLLKQIQNSYNPSVDATELEILDPILEAEVLVLDDLGAVKPSQWVWDTVSYIINHRYNEKKTTIVTTNFPDSPPASAEEPIETPTERAKAAARKETLGDRITERMRSRLHEMCRVVKMAGEDFRLIRLKKQ